jgi:hypothetical protein
VCNGRGDEGVFIGPKSNRRLAKGEYIRYYYIAVQRLSRTSRYYPEGILKSSICPVLLSVCPILLSVRPCTIYRVRRTIYQLMSSGPPAYISQKVAYVRTKRQ